MAAINLAGAAIQMAFQKNLSDGITAMFTSFKHTDPMPAGHDTLPSLVLYSEFHMPEPPDNINLPDWVKKLNETLKAVRQSSLEFQEELRKEREGSANTPRTVKEYVKGTTPIHPLSLHYPKMATMILLPKNLSFNI